MLVMRKEQMEVFRAAAQRAFENAMVAHLVEFSPFLFQAVGEESFRVTVTQGMAQAAAYGFDQRGPVRLYLELMLLFGHRFDTDPQYPWAAAILTDRKSGTQIQRTERLYDQALAYRRAVAGPDGVLARRALTRLRAWAADPQALPTEALIPALLADIAVIYPEKAAFVGEEALTVLLHKASEGARNQRFRTPRAIALVAALMLACGHGCGADPVYPWINRALRDEQFTDPEARARRLEEQSLAWLDHVLASLPQETPVLATRAVPPPLSEDATMTHGKDPTPPSALLNASAPCDSHVQT